MASDPCSEQFLGVGTTEQRFGWKQVTPLGVFSEVFILKGFKSCVLEVRILKGLQACFVEVRIVKDLVIGDW